MFYLFAGHFLAHKDFYAFRDSITYSLYRTRATDGAHVEALVPYINALKEAPNLDLFLSESHEYNIVNLLEAQISSLSYLGQMRYTGVGTLPTRETYLNEYAANRCFLDAYSFFAYKEDQSFFKGFLTPIIPILHSIPGRDLKGRFEDNEVGIAHALAFDIIDILIRHYIYTGQDEKVYSFVEDQGQREGPYYFQKIILENISNLGFSGFASMGFSVAWHETAVETLPK